MNRIFWVRDKTVIYYYELVYFEVFVRKLTFNIFFNLYDREKTKNNLRFVYLKVKISLGKTTKIVFI